MYTRICVELCYPSQSIRDNISQVLKRESLCWFQTSNESNESEERWKWEVNKLSRQTLCK